MTMPTTTPAPAHRTDTALGGLAAFVVYALLRQETLYSVDAHGFLLTTLHGGVTVNPTHFAYMPLLAAAREFAGLVGMQLHAAAVLLSALGMAFGVACTHAANRMLGLSRRDAALATALVGLAPAVVFFATVVEIHGEHFGTCGLSFVATVWFAARPTAGRGAWLGAATGLGYLGHATGALLPALTVPVGIALVRRRGGSWRTAVPGLAVAVAVHALALAALPLLLQVCGFPVTSARAAGLLQMHLRGLLADPAVVFDTLWRDWLRPFLPIAAVAILAGGLRPVRGLALATLAAATVYLVVTAAMLVPFVDGVLLPGHGTERGAYLLPLAWPASLATVLAARRWAFPLLLLSAVVAVVDVKAHDTRPQRPFAEGLREVLGGRPVFVIAGEHGEVASFLVDLPEYRVDVDWQQLIFLDGLPPERLPAAWVAYDEWLRGKHAAGVELWITAGGVATLSAPAWTKGKPAGPRLLENLRASYRWEERRARGFVGWRLVPLPR